jgi:hypothetical protein
MTRLEDLAMCDAAAAEWNRGRLTLLMDDHEWSATRSAFPDEATGMTVADGSIIRTPFARPVVVYPTDVSP